jgi:DNA-binding LacI/PurR family transcriptional regulator
VAATRSNNVTLKDVAQAAGVSVQTASNVLRERFDLMRPETRQRVETAMRDLGYHPNLAGRSLRISRTFNVAFLVLDEAPNFLADPLTDLIIGGIGDVARDRGYGVLIQGERPLGGKRTLLRPLLERRVDGAVVLMSGPRDVREAYLKDIKDTGEPVVVLDEVLNDQQLFGVRTAERKSARALTRHLLENGHERIAFIAARVPWPLIEERHAGYLEAHDEAGLRPQRSLQLFEATWQAEGGRLMAEKLLGRKRRPTAIMCGSDVLAIGALAAAKRAGVSVPGDVAITGFDDFEFSAFVDPPLTTVAVAGYEQGRLAGEMLIDYLEGRPIASRHVVLENELRLRDST